MNGTNSTISTPDEQSARTYGLYKVILSLPVDGGFSINTFAATGDHRFTALSFTTPDVDCANLAHRVIKQGAEQGVSPEGIRQALDDALRTELFRMQSRRDTPSRNRVEHINALLDLMESPFGTAQVVELVDSMRQPAATPRPRTFAELRDAYAAAAAADRAARKAGA